jgi:uncharacterized membrane protein
MASLEKATKKAVKTVAQANPAKKGPLSGAKGVAAGAALVALAPLAGRGVAKLTGPKLSELGDEVREKVDDMTPDGVGDVLPDMPDIGNPFGGDDADNGDASPGHGSGRRMPVQQAVDVAVPLEEAYNHWTQFEEWPAFMHRLENVEQVDDATVTFQSKFWGISKRFEAQIVEQKPDEKIEWDVTDGVAHTGVVTFHQLSERLTRIELTLDIEPNGLVEKAGRGWRFAKRGIRGDLHRFKAYVELNDEPAKGWRGTIEDGEVKRRTDRKQTTRPKSASKSSNGSGQKATASSGSNSSSGSRKKASASSGSNSSSGSRKKASAKK